MRRNYRDSDAVIAKGISLDVRSYVRKELNNMEERIVKQVENYIKKACEEARLVAEKDAPVPIRVREEGISVPREEGS